MALTGKRKAFAEAKKAGKSNKDAALAAGYSAATASAAGSRLVKDKEVAAYLVKAKAASEKDAPVAPIDPEPTRDAKEFLELVMLGLIGADAAQIKAATALLPFQHQKLGEGGKKELREEAAKKVAGRFASAAPPKLVAAGGRKV